jgi:hypothetical protein
MNTNSRHRVRVLAVVSRCSTRTHGPQPKFGFSRDVDMLLPKFFQTPKKWHTMLRKIQSLVPVNRMMLKAFCKSPRSPSVTPGLVAKYTRLTTIGASAFHHFRAFFLHQLGITCGRIKCVSIPSHKNLLLLLYISLRYKFFAQVQWDAGQALYCPESGPAQYA